MRYRSFGAGLLGLILSLFAFSQPRATGPSDELTATCHELPGGDSISILCQIADGSDPFDPTGRFLDSPRQALVEMGEVGGATVASGVVVAGQYRVVLVIVENPRGAFEDAGGFLLILLGGDFALISP